MILLLFTDKTPQIIYLYPYFLTILFLNNYLFLPSYLKCFLLTIKSCDFGSVLSSLPIDSFGAFKYLLKVSLVGFLSHGFCSSCVPSSCTLLFSFPLSPDFGSSPFCPLPSSFSTFSFLVITTPLLPSPTVTPNSDLALAPC